MNPLIRPPSDWSGLHHFRGDFCAMIEAYFETLQSTKGGGEGTKTSAGVSRVDYDLVHSRLGKPVVC